MKHGFGFARAFVWPLAVTVCFAFARGATAQDEGEQPTAPGESVSELPEGLITQEKLDWHLSDPERVSAWAREKLEEALADDDQINIKIHRRGLERMGSIHRPEQLRLTLEEALRLALANSYDLEVQRFNPAIEATRVVEAEAAFDAVFFSNLTKSIQDQPTASQLSATYSNNLNADFGVRKLLPTGMQASAAYGFNRTYIDFQFQTLNPAYSSDLVLELSQPFLRGFGIDYNRSWIVLARNNKRISDLAFARQVRDKLRNVEELYWRLVQARRNLVTSARLLADFESIYDNLVARKDFDITPVQIAATKADLEGSKADFVEVRAVVFDAEDRLIAAMNADHPDLADDIEIIPVDFPHTRQILVDRLAEVQDALDHRPEINEQELRIASTKVAFGQAKNQELPKLDVLFRYTVDGLGVNWDRSFEELTRHDYTEYYVGVQFEVPIGNRGPRAASHRARLEHAQAVANLKAVLEGVILEVNLAVRQLNTAYDKINPSFESVEAREREVDSIVARAERKDLNTLKNELGARQTLAASRNNLLAAMVDYNLAIIDLERAKGMLLRYNNVVIPPVEE